MNINYNDAMKEFVKKDFIQKKEFLLSLLKNLYWEIDLVDKLWQAVYNFKNERKQDLLTDIYKIILECIENVDKKKQWEAINNYLKSKNDFLSNIKLQEKSERDNIDLEQLLSSI
jgi:hypothetical protein